MAAFDRSPKRKKKTESRGKTAGVLLTTAAALGGAFLATRGGTAPEKPRPDTAGLHVQPHKADSAEPQSQDDAADPLDNEDPNLSGDDLDRARENAAFKQRMAGAIQDALPNGFTVMWTTATDGRPEYNEFLQINDPNGHRVGDVYPDEVAGDMRFLVDENLARFYGQTIGSPLAAFDSSNPADIARAAQDAQQLAGFQDQWDAHNTEWADKDHFVTAEDGTTSLNPDYAAEEEAIKSGMADAAAGSATVTTASENEERAENAAEDADTGG